MGKSGNLQAHRLCSRGPQRRTPSAPAGWVSLKPCCSFLRQGTDKSVSLRGVNTAATCHSILVLLELYAQLIASTGQLNSEKAETEASADSVFSLAHIIRFLFLDWRHRCKELMQLPRPWVSPFSSKNSALEVLQFEKKLLCACLPHDEVDIHPMFPLWLPSAICRDKIKAFPSWTSSKPFTGRLRTGRFLRRTLGQLFLYIQRSQSWERKPVEKGLLSM